MRNILLAAALKIFSRLPAPQQEGVIKALISRRLAALPPDEGLRFLFRLDAALYVKESQKAIEWGGGLHPKHRFMRYHDFFVDRIGAHETVLDLGCGNGVVACDIAGRSGAQVVAIDLNPENIAAARRLHAHPRVEYVVGDILQDLPGRRCDVVVLSNVLEHLPDRPAFLQGVRRVVDNRRFLLRIPLFERDWRVPLQKELGLDWRLDSTHETEYTLESFQSEMDAAGLEVVHQEVRWGEIWAEAVPHAA